MCDEVCPVRPPLELDPLASPVPLPDHENDAPLDLPLDPRLGMRLTRMATTTSRYDALVGRDTTERLCEIFLQHCASIRYRAV